MSSPIQLAVLLSGTGRTLQNLVAHIRAGTLNANITTVIASRDGLAGIDVAREARLAHRVVPRKDFSDCESFSERVFDIIDNAGADLICMGGWLSMVQIPDRYESRVINIHPALLPSFGGKGMYGLNVHRAVLEHGCKVSGCTVQFVDAEYDNGPIILQRCCAVREDDAPQTLAERVFEEEKIAYPEAIRLFAAGRLSIDGRRVRIKSS